MTLDTFHQRLLSLGTKPQHCGYFYRSLFGVMPRIKPDDPKFPLALRKALPELYAIIDGALVVADSHQAEEKDSLKLLFKLHDGHTIESVLLPRDGVCVSSQVGCAVGCAFCMTGKGGLERQLSSAEIAAQYVAATRIKPDIKKVVLMGMGEPSHNLAAVKEAVAFMGDVAGLAHKQIVVSTVGDERLFDALPTWSVKPALALSLHTTDFEKRKKLLKNAPALTPEYLLQRTLDYAEQTKYPAQIEWTLLASINDTFEEVERLAELVAGRYAMVNFIAVNPTEGSDFKRPDQEHIEDLITVLRRKGIVATLRDSAAQDIEGGCGQLRARHLSARQEVPISLEKMPS